MTIEEGIKLLNQIGMKELGLTKTKRVKRGYWRCEYCERKVKKQEMLRHEKYGHLVRWVEQ